MPSTTSPSPGITSPAVDDAPGRRAAARRRRRSSTRAVGAQRARAVVSVRVCAQRRRLRLAAAFGHRLGEVGEQHGEPQPDARRDRRRRSAGARRRRDEHVVVSTRADLDDEHHRVAAHRARVELARGVGSAADSAGGVERPPASTAAASAGRGGAVTVSRQRPARRSGRARGRGKKVRPATITTTPTSRPTNSGVSVGKRAGGRRDAAACAASEPARASTRTIRKNRPSSIATPEGRCCSSRCSPVRPANARAVVVGGRGEGVEHLGSPCGPALQIERRRPIGSDDRERRCRASTSAGVDQDVERDELHLARPGSSCRGTPACGPTISPAMNTASTARTSIP